jgi:hypothetical protein
VLGLNTGDVGRIAALMADIATRVLPECRAAPGA